MASSTSTASLVQPDYMHRFRAAAVKPLIAETLRSELSKVRYEAEDMPELTKTIGERINGRLAAEAGLSRYKLITNVSIFQDDGIGARMGTNMIWDTESDGVAQEVYSNGSVKCVAVVFATEYHHYNIAATCLFFACKAEETLRKLDDFIPVIVYYASKGILKAPPGTSEFEKWRAVILHNEIVLLQALCFDMVIDHPHSALIELTQLLELKQPLSQMAWSFVADCMKLPVCLVYSPKAIAYASLSLATRVASSDVRGGLLDDSWLDRVSANRHEVAEIIQWVLEFYAREAQSRLAHASSDQTAEISPTPASSPGSTTTSPMPHIQ
ncbi:hypothetical protein GGI12_003194 [Dipsacomyces acuminosporus]|nr:hypothetical protein GGI12_003194 [Dipsacomyces acuminosporus]